MYCLYCGDCCLRMSPLSTPNPCPHLIKDDNFYFCGIYKNRPIECKTHDFPFRFCPIGLDILKLNNIDNIQRRLNNGYDKTKLLNR